MLNTFHKHLEPRELTTSALTCSARDLVGVWGEFLLLVQLDDPNGGLAKALRTGGLTTSAAFVAGNPDSAVVVPGRTNSMRPQEAWPESLIAQQLKARLVRSAHFALAIVKRSGRPILRGDRFSIGRSADSDLLLLANGVSKMHAWLRKCDDGKIELADNGSRNGTTISGTRIAPQRPTVLAPGDVLGFGGVEVMFCPTASVWTVVRGA